MRIAALSLVARYTCTGPSALVSIRGCVGVRALRDAGRCGAPGVVGHVDLQRGVGHLEIGEGHVRRRPAVARAFAQMENRFVVPPSGAQLHQVQLQRVGPHVIEHQAARQQARKEIARLHMRAC